MEKNTVFTTSIGGIQWLLFMFTNTIVIPLSIGTAFGLTDANIAASVQRAFIYTGIACLLQVLFGHRLSLMEGQSGLWWGVILGLSASVSQASESHLGGALAIGIIASGIAVAVLGMLGMGNVLKKLFPPVVMSVFLFLLTVQLIGIFFKGMLGLSNGGHIQPVIACLSIFLVILVVVLLIMGKGLISNFALLIGILIGWPAFTFLLPEYKGINLSHPAPLVQLFPWGQPVWDTGIVLTAFLAGLINTTNTVATLKGAESVYESTVDDKKYKNSFLITGINTIVSGFFGLVPYAPYTSSLGFLNSTRIKARSPFIVGALLFILLGSIPVLGRFFATIPVSVGDAVLFVAYLQLFGSALKNLEGIHFDYKTVYRIAIPVMAGISLMLIPPDGFRLIPGLIRPLLNNGLLIGILLAVILENSIRWEKLKE